MGSAKSEGVSNPSTFSEVFLSLQPLKEAQNGKEAPKRESICVLLSGHLGDSLV